MANNHFYEKDRQDGLHKIHLRGKIMVNINKVIIYTIIITVLIYLCVGCSLSSKPPEEVIKNVIAQFSNLANNKDVSGVKFDTFNITNGFVSKTPGGGGESSPYNIEVDYKVSFTLNKYVVGQKSDKVKSINDEIIKTEIQLNQLLEFGKVLQSQIENPGISTLEVINENIQSNSASAEGCRVKILNLKNQIESINQQPDLIVEKKEIVNNNARFWFVKKGDKWYGGEGWR